MNRELLEELGLTRVSPFVCFEWVFDPVSGGTFWIPDPPPTDTSSTTTTQDTTQPEQPASEPVQTQVGGFYDPVTGVYIPEGATGYAPTEPPLSEGTTPTLPGEPPPVSEPTPPPVSVDEGGGGTTSEPTPPPTTTDLAAREAELKAALDYANQIKSGQATLPEGTDETAYWQSVTDIQQKYDLLIQAKEVEQSYQQAGQALTPEAQKFVTQARQISASPASPFVQLTDGNIQIIGSLSSAEKAGVSISDFEKLGFNGDELRAMKAREDAVETLKPYGTDVVKAVGDGHADAVGLLYGQDVKDKAQYAYMMGMKQAEVNLLMGIPISDTSGYVKIDENTYISQSDWNSLPQESQDLIRSKGYQAYVDWVSQIQTNTDIAVKPANLMPYEAVVGSNKLTDRAKTLIISAYYPEKYDLYVKRGGKTLEELGVDKSLGVPKVNAYQWLQNFKTDSGGYDLAGFFKTVYNDPGSSNDADALLRSLNIPQKDIQDAKIAAFSKGSMVVDDSVQRPNVFERAATQLNNWVENARGESIQQSGTISNTLLRDANLGASGVLVAGMSMVPQMVIMPGIAITRPEKIVPMARDMVKGTVQSVKMLNPAAMANPFDIAVSTFNIGMMADLARGPIMKVVSYISPNSLSAGLAGIEPSTAHIPTNKVEYSHWITDRVSKQIDPSVLKPEVMAKAIDAAIVEATKKPDFLNTKSVIEIPIEGTDLKMTVLFTPVQRTIGQSVFHSTNEGMASFELTKPIEMVDAKLGQINPVTVKEVKGVLTGDKFDKNGGLIETAPTHENPIVGGAVRRRVTDVVVNDQGHVLLVTDRMEPKGYYGLPGGDLISENLAPGSAQAGIRYPVEAFADMQLSSETGVGFVNGTEQRLPAYLGQANRHSLPGTYVVLAKAENVPINLGHYIEETIATAKKEGRDLTPDEIKEINRGPELSDAVWWDGKTPIEVSPATYDILVKLVQDNKLSNIDVTKLSISKATPTELLTARDPGYYRPADLSVGGVTEVASTIDTGYKELVAGKSGVYKTPWFAGAYTKGGSGQGAVLWEIVDPETFKVPENRGNLPEGPVYIRNAKEGEYLPSKLYQGTLESEVVSAPGTKIIIPEPNANLETRVLTGKAADFSIYQNGKFIPVQMGIQPELLASGKFDMPTPAKLYAAKLLALDNTLRNASYAIKHPQMAIADIVKNVMAAVKYPGEVLEGDTTTNIPMPGLREIYIDQAKTNLGARINQMARSIRDEAIRIYRDERGSIGKTLDDLPSDEVLRTYEDRAYANRVSGMLADYSREVSAYNTNQIEKQRIEDLYAENLSYSVEGMAKYDMLERQTVNEIYKSVYPESTIRTPESGERLVTRPESRVIEAPVARVAEPEPTEPRPMEPEPTEPRPTEPRPEEPRPTQPEPIEPRPLEPRPIEPRPVEPRPIEPRPIEPEPIEPRPPIRITEPRPFEPYPVEPRPYEPEPIEKPVVIRKPKDQQKYDEQVKRIKPGTIAWVQGRPEGGAMYRVVVPPYTDEEKFTMRYPPPGYDDQGWEGEGSAFKSIQIIGGPLPHDVENLDLGVVKINVKMEGGKPVISYAKDLDSNTGQRAKTVGMGRGQIPVEAWYQARDQGIAYADFVRDYNGPLVGGGETPPNEPVAESPTSVAAEAAKPVPADTGATRDYKGMYDNLVERANEKGYAVKEVPYDQLKDYEAMNPMFAKTIGYQMPDNEIHMNGYYNKGMTKHTWLEMYDNLHHELDEMGLIQRGDKYWQAHNQALQDEKTPNLHMPKPVGPPVEETEPVQEPRRRVRRPTRDWFDDRNYQPVPNETTPVAKAYLGRRLLPPNLEGSV